MQKKKIVIALGGNALLRGNQIGTIEEQLQNTYDTLKNIVPFIKEGHEVILSHGNGPQVGNILMKNDAGASTYDLPQMPLDVCVADSQGSIGYMLERTLRNILKEEGIDKEVVTLVTQVEVDKNDLAFQNPTKRVGKVYPKAEADKLAAEKGWKFKESPKMEGGQRRVVPSPSPKSIMNIQAIEKLAASGAVVIASGGGGIPVYYDEKNQIQPLEAVIDKDKASAVMASNLNADEFYILTDVPYVYVDYKQAGERKLESLNKADAEKYMAQGKFGEGNMAPKIRACLNFIENGGHKSVITEATKLTDKSYGTKITMEYEN